MVLSAAGRRQKVEQTSLPCLFFFLDAAFCLNRYCLAITLTLEVAERIQWNRTAIFTQTILQQEHQKPISKGFQICKEVLYCISLFYLFDDFLCLSG